jgi:hypothetical protein
LSFGKVFRLLFKGFGIDPEEVKPSPEELALLQQRQAVQEQAIAMAREQGNAQQAPGGVNAPQPSNEMDFEPGSGAGMEG